ncbi:hypothetical protein GH733_009847 [Mirounga leonina]|nr:hypothetical protein GH733_009847 [Mirounga leonina]
MEKHHVLPESMMMMKFQILWRIQRKLPRMKQTELSQVLKKIKLEEPLARKAECRMGKEPKEEEALELPLDDFEVTDTTTGSEIRRRIEAADGRPLALKDIWEGIHECYKTQMLQEPWDTITQQSLQPQASLPPPQVLPALSGLDGMKRHVFGKSLLALLLPAFSNSVYCSNKLDLLSNICLGIALNLLVVKNIQETCVHEAGHSEEAPPCAVGHSAGLGTHFMLESGSKKGQLLSQGGLAEVSIGKKQDTVEEWVGVGATPSFSSAFYPLHGQAAPPSSLHCS